MLTELATEKAHATGALTIPFVKRFLSLLRDETAFYTTSSTAQGCEFNGAEMTLNVDHQRDANHANLLC